MAQLFIHGLFTVSFQVWLITTSAGDYQANGNTHVFNGVTHVFTVDSGYEAHFFLIGNWAGNFRDPSSPPSVWPSTRSSCSRDQFVMCAESDGKKCGGCDFVKGIDDKANFLVANSFKKRAAVRGPKFILNVGGNVHGISSTDDFEQVFRDAFEKVYYGPGLDGVPWLSVLGNADVGTKDQQIAYTGQGTGRWVMPAEYYSVRANFPFFKVDFFMLDSSHQSASNLCTVQQNLSTFRSLTAAGGPVPLPAEFCEGLRKKWADQQEWLKEQLPRSHADWQIVVTHAPCGSDQEFYKHLRTEFGLDLVVTGHRRIQQMGSPPDMAGLTCLISGGGGGMISEIAPPRPPSSTSSGDAPYGFFDLSITKREISIDSVDHEGRVVNSLKVHPVAAALSALRAV